MKNHDIVIATLKLFDGNGLHGYAGHILAEFERKLDLIGPEREANVVNGLKQLLADAVVASAHEPPKQTPPTPPQHTPPVELPPTQTAPPSDEPPQQMP